MVNVMARPPPVIRALASAVPQSIEPTVPVMTATVAWLLTIQLVQATPL